MAEFQKPNLAALPVIQQLSPQDRDAYQRVVAAGMKMMYSPETRQDLQQAIQSQDPIPKKLAENVVGLMLLLDQKSKGGIPLAAIFPAAIDLLGEAAEILTSAGQVVSQEDFHDASLLVFAMIGKKLGVSDQQMMQGLESALPPEAKQEEGAAQTAAAQPRQIGMLGTGGAA